MGSSSIVLGAAGATRGNDVLDSSGSVVHDHMRSVGDALGSMRTEWSNRRAQQGFEGTVNQKEIRREKWFLIN